MLRFTRRQYETVLRRGGVPESGLGYGDQVQLVSLLDDFRPQLPEQRILHAYMYGPCTATAAQMAMFELTAPEGGMWVEAAGSVGQTGTWCVGVGAGASLITTAKATPAPRQIRDDVGATEAVLAVGTAVAYFGTLALHEFAAGIEQCDVQNALPLYVPMGRRFFIHGATANETVNFRCRWKEPGA